MITAEQLKINDAVSGYKLIKSYKGDGTLRLHRVGVHSQVEYFTEAGKFSHILRSFTDQNEAEAFINKACGETS